MTSSEWEPMAAYLWSENAELTGRIEALTEAMRFYADGGHHHGDIIVDRGEIAKSALSGGSKDEAKVRLIAAAPDMLAALKAVEEVACNGWTGEAAAYADQMVAAAIAKAEGRS